MKGSSSFSTYNLQYLHFIRFCYYVLEASESVANRRLSLGDLTIRVLPDKQ